MVPTVSKDQDDATELGLTATPLAAIFTAWKLAPVPVGSTCKVS
jgi:hypothetical protein